MELDEWNENEPQIVKFCGECNNMLVPMNEERTLVYKCIKQGCYFKTKIEGKSKFENLVSSKVFSKEKNLIIDKDFMLDPTMPRENINCPTCNYNSAVFLISTDIEDTIIELIYICASKNCGFTWRKETLE